MLKPHTIFATLFLLILSITNAQAQGDSARSDKPEAPTITASASGERVRFTAPSSIVQTRLEVYDSTGKKVFDIEVRGGNVVDWRLQDGQAGPLADDTYLCAITVKSLSGKITQRIGSVTIQKGIATVRAADASQMTAQQAQAIGPVDENASLSVVSGDETLTTTVVAHNGEEGQITRGRGALSFRLGDFFNGKDTEQMRLTAEGNFGIGISNPQAKLDVDGLIRSNQGIVFPDGSIQLSAARKTLGAASKKPGQFGDHPIDAQGEDSPVTPSIAGTGTTGQIPKWQNGPSGILTDSVITELNGSIGINGPPSPTYKLDVNGHNRFRGANVSFYLTGAKAGGNEWLFQTIDDDGRLRIFENSIGHAERFSILQNGNVGIGTANPQQNLSINGALVVDQAGLNNGSFNPGITFGSFSGEGISSMRSAGSTQNGLSFFTHGFNRMNILNNGNVGIGTTAPNHLLTVGGIEPPVVGGAALGIYGADASYAIARDTTHHVEALFGADATTVGGASGAALFGSMTNHGVEFRTNNTSRMVITPGGNVGIGTTNPAAKFNVQATGGISVFGINSSGQAVAGNSHDGYGVIGNTVNGSAVYGSNLGSNTTGYAGFFDGRVAISGNLSANNLPGVEFDVPTDVFRSNLDIGLNTNQTATIKTITVDVPADGFLVLVGSVFAFSYTGEPGHTAVARMDLFDETSNTTFGTAWFSDPSIDTQTIQGVLPVSAGSRTISLKVKADGGNSDHASLSSATGTLIAMFFPKRY